MRGAASYYSRKYIIATPTTCLYMLCACMLCWGLCFIGSVGYPVFGEVTAPPLWNVVCQVLPSKVVTYAIGMLLTFGSAFLVHRVNSMMMLIREKTLLPFLFYALLISTNPAFFPLKPTSLGVFCLILAVYELFTAYHDAEATGRAFNASLLISVGSLLWVHILWFLPLFWMGMYNFRSLGIKTFMASLLGVCTVYWFVLGWCVWQWDFTAFTIPFAALLNVRFATVIGVDIVNSIHLVFWMILVFVASLNIITHGHEDVLRTRQFLSFLIMMVVWTFGLFLFYEQSSEELLEMACVPSSILISHFFAVTRGKYVYWFFHLSVLIFLVLLFARIWSF